MPLLWRRHKCCKCAGCASITGDPLDEKAGTHKSDTSCCETGGDVYKSVSTCTSNTSCCRFVQTTNGKTALTLTVPTFGTLVFTDASIQICGSSGTCAVGGSLTALTHIRAAMIVSGKVIEVYMRIRSVAYLYQEQTLDCGPWNSDHAGGASCILDCLTDACLVYVVEQCDVKEYSSSVVSKNSTAICGSGQTQFYCEHSGGTLERSFSGTGQYFVEDANAPIIPSDSSITFAPSGCSSAAISWSFTPAPTVVNTSSQTGAAIC